MSHTYSIGDFAEKVYIDNKWIKLSLTTEFIKKVNPNKIKIRVKNDKGLITHISYKFNKNNYIEFNKIFDTISFANASLTIVLSLVEQANMYFTDYRLSDKTMKFITSSIKSLYKN